MPGQYFNLGHDIFITHPSRFSIHNNLVLRYYPSVKTLDGSHRPTGHYSDKKNRYPRYESKPFLPRNNFVHANWPTTTRSRTRFLPWRGSYPSVRYMYTSVCVVLGRHFKTGNIRLHKHIMPQINSVITIQQPL